MQKLTDEQLQIIADAPKRPPGHMSDMARELLAARKVVEAYRIPGGWAVKLPEALEAYDKVVKDEG